MYWESLSFFQEVIKQISIYRYEQRHRNFNQSLRGLEQPRDGGAVCQGRGSCRASRGACLAAGQGLSIK